MAQAYVDQCRKEDITLTELPKRNRVVWNLNSTHEVTTKKVKRELKVYLQEGKKTMSISEQFLERLVFSEILQLIISFVKEDGS